MSEVLETVVTGADLAMLAGVSERHIRRLGLPKTARGQYRLGDAIPALLEALAGGDAGAELTKERVRLVKAQADRAEIEVAKAKGLVAPLEEIGRAWEKMSMVIQRNVMNVAQRTVIQLLNEGDEARFKRVMRAELTLALKTAAETDVDLDDEQDLEGDANDD